MPGRVQVLSRGGVLVRVANPARRGALDRLTAPDERGVPARAGPPRPPAQVAAVAREHDGLAPGDPAPPLCRGAALPDVRRPQDAADGPPQGAGLSPGPP